MTQDEAKALVGKRAAEMVEDGMRVGLGTGSTSVMFIRALGERVKDGLKIRCVASSDASEKLGRELGMEVVSLAEMPELDVYIDGADEVARVSGGSAQSGSASSGSASSGSASSGSASSGWAQGGSAQGGSAQGGAGLGGLALIKGGGGALLREKIVASAAKRFVVVVDESKMVEKLGKFPLPVEVIKMALPLVEKKLAALGLNPKQRQAKSGDGPYLTDEGNYILDCACGVIEDPAKTAAEIRAIVGVVEHGLFLGMASLALVAGETGVKEVKA